MADQPNEIPATAGLSSFTVARSWCAVISVPLRVTPSILCARNSPSHRGNYTVDFIPKSAGSDQKSARFPAKDNNRARKELASPRKTSGAESGGVHGALESSPAGRLSEAGPRHCGGYRRLSLEEDSDE